MKEGMNESTVPFWGALRKSSDYQYPALLSLMPLQHPEQRVLTSLFKTFHEVWRLLLLDLLLCVENHAMGLKSIISVILSRYHRK